MTRTYWPVLAAFAVLGAGLAGCETGPRYPIAPGGSAGPTGRAEAIRPEYPVRAAPSLPPAPYARPAEVAAAPPPAAPPPAAEEDAPGPRVAPEPVEAAPLAPAPSAPSPAAPYPPPPGRFAAAPSVSTAPALSEAQRRRLEARRREAVEAKAKSYLPARRGAAVRTYTFAKGDTLYGLGRRFGLGPKAVADAAGLSLSSTLHPGATMTLPGAAKDGEPQANANGEVSASGGGVLSPTRAEREAALARAERAIPPVPVAAAEHAGASPYGPLVRSAPTPARLASAAPTLAPIGGELPATAVRPAPVRPTSLTALSTSRPAATARALPAPTRPSEALDETAGLSGGPRPYASLGASQTPRRSLAAPEPEASYDEEGRLPSSQSGKRTAADAQAAYAVAAARAAARSESAARSAGSLGAASGVGRFVWPVRGQVISGFGPKGPGQRNDGVDIAALDGDPVRAAAAGEVVYAGHDVPALGNLVAVKHPDGWVTIYANLQRITVKPRDVVAQGGQVGLAGHTGDAGRAQVHFEVRYAADPAEKAKAIDPQLVLPPASGLARAG